MTDVPRQLALFDLPPARRLSRRELAAQYPHILYFALRPSPSDASAIWQFADGLSRQHGAGPPLPVENLHISMLRVGQYRDLPDSAVQQALRAGRALRSPPFEVVFDRALSWGNAARRPFVLCCSTGGVEFTALCAALARELGRLGFAVKPAGVPHLTLWYGERSLPEQPLAKPFRCRMDEFWLIHSLHGSGRHRWPGRWRLQAGEAGTLPPPLVLL